MYGSGLNQDTQYIMFSLTNNLKYFVFLPAIIFIFMYSIYILLKIIKRQSDTIDLFTLYAVILFYMFSTVYFITEGQGRYCFPLIFIFVYCFYSIFNVVVQKIIQLRLK